MPGRRAVRTDAGWRRAKANDTFVHPSRAPAARTRHDSGPDTASQSLKWTTQFGFSIALESSPGARIIVLFPPKKETSSERENLLLDAAAEATFPSKAITSKPKPNPSLSGRRGGGEEVGDAKVEQEYRETFDLLCPKPLSQPKTDRATEERPFAKVVYRLFPGKHQPPPVRFGLVRCCRVFHIFFIPPFAAPSVSHEPCTKNPFAVEDHIHLETLGGRDPKLHLNHNQNGKLGTIGKRGKTMPQREGERGGRREGVEQNEDYSAPRNAASDDGATSKRKEKHSLTEEAQPKTEFARNVRVLRTDPRVYHHHHHHQHHHRLHHRCRRRRRRRRRHLQNRSAEEDFLPLSANGVFDCTPELPPPGGLGWKENSNFPGKAPV